MHIDFVMCKKWSLFETIELGCKSLLQKTLTTALNCKSVFKFNNGIFSDFPNEKTSATIINMGTAQVRALLKAQLVIWWKNISRCKF